MQEIRELQDRRCSNIIDEDFSEDESGASDYDDETSQSESDVFSSKYF